HRPRPGSGCPVATAGGSADAGRSSEVEKEDNVKHRRYQRLTGAILGALLVASMGAAVRAQDATPSPSAATEATPGQAVKMMLLPKFIGIAVFDQAHQGAEEAAKELGNTTPLDFVGPTASEGPTAQVEFVTNAPAGGYKVVMLSNNAGDQIAPAAQAA